MKNNLFRKDYFIFLVIVSLYRLNKIRYLCISSLTSFINAFDGEIDVNVTFGGLIFKAYGSQMFVVYFTQIKSELVVDG